MSHVSVVGLGFGDEGKGSITDWLCRNRPVDYVIRFQGGGQAAHNVRTPEGIHHTFSHFGSGTLAGVPTVLSRFMVINPLGLAKEADALAEKGVQDPRSSLYIDSRAMLTLPPHVGLIKAREASRGDDRHGSTNFGLAEVMRFALDHPDEVIRVGDLMGKDPRDFIEKYLVLDRWSREQNGKKPAADTNPLFVASVEERWSQLRDALGSANILDPAGMARIVGRCKNLLFEGAQGVLLDEWYGFHPHTTWSTTTFENVYTLLGEWGNPQPVEKLGILRSYHTRHGYGPFPTYDPELTLRFDEADNKNEGGMGAFRAGHFDAILAGYAMEVCGGVDSLAITHMDRAVEVKVCREYEQEWGMPIRHLDLNPVKTDLWAQAELTRTLFNIKPRYRSGKPVSFWDFYQRGDFLGAKIMVESWGPSASDKHAPMALTTGSVG